MATSKFSRVRIYVGLIDNIGRQSNFDMVPYHAVLSKYLRDRMPDLFQACTVYDSLGMWEGKAEASKVIEILRDEAVDHNSLIFKDKIRTLSEELKTLLNQDCVLVTEDVTYGTFI